MLPNLRLEDTKELKNMELNDELNALFSEANRELGTWLASPKLLPLG